MKLTGSQNSAFPWSVTSNQRRKPNHRLHRVESRTQPCPASCLTPKQLHLLIQPHHHTLRCRHILLLQPHTRHLHILPHLLTRRILPVRACIHHLLPTLLHQPVIPLSLLQVILHSIRPALLLVILHSIHLQLRPVTLQVNLNLPYVNCLFG